MTLPRTGDPLVPEPAARTACHHLQPCPSLQTIRQRQPADSSSRSITFTPLGWGCLTALGAVLIATITVLASILLGADGMAVMRTGGAAFVASCGLGCGLWYLLRA